MESKYGWENLPRVTSNEMAFTQWIIGQIPFLKSSGISSANVCGKMRASCEEGKAYYVIEIGFGEDFLGRLPSNMIYLKGGEHSYERDGFLSTEYLKESLNDVKCEIKRAGFNDLSMRLHDNSLRLFF